MGLLKSHTPAAWCPLAWKILCGIPGISINTSIPKAIPRCVTSHAFSSAAGQSADQIASDPESADQMANYDGNLADPYRGKNHHLTGIQKKTQSHMGFLKSHTL